MYDPKFRLALLISLIVFFGSMAHAVYTYMLGDHGLNVEDYITGIALVGSSIIGGVLFVVISVKFITFEKHKTTGFEPTFRDETGTGFNFPVSLSKFLPEIIAPPLGADMHPLESELIGFLNGYRKWPYKLPSESDDRTTLYEHSIKQWEAMKTLPNCTSMHRIAALAQDLSLVYAYKEKRTKHPVSQFWKRDTVRYSRACIEHGGYSALILSTIPTFRKLGKDKQSNQRLRRALLTAIRYRDNPTSIPANCDPLARDIYESLHKANQKSKVTESGEVTFNPSKEQIKDFNTEVYSYFQAVIRDAELNPSDISKNSDGVYLGDGYIAIGIKELVQKFSLVMSPQTRSVFELWELNGTAHPSWSYFMKALQNFGGFTDKWDDVTSASGLFNLKVNDVDFNNMLFTFVDQTEMPDLRNALDSMPKFNGMIELQQDKETLLIELKRKANAVTKMLDNF